MSELIDKAVLMDKMHKYGFTAPDMTVHEFIEDELPTVAAPRWHRVEEEPKESGKQYVVWASKGYAYCDKWLGDRWLISNVAPETVTHWMPIEPPKEDA